MPNNPEDDRWFNEELQAHAEALRGWLRRRFPSLEDVDNVVQETMSRVWQARSHGPVKSPRALLYATAHNFAVDQLRRQRVVPMEALAEKHELPVFEDGPTPADRAARNQELELLTAAIQSLPDKCRQVLTLRKIYGLSQKEIAGQLGICEHTVEAQVGNGMRRCAAFLAKHGLP